MQGQQIRKAINAIKSHIDVHGAMIQDGRCTPQQEKNIQSEIDDLTILIEFVESKLNNSFQSRMKELLNDLVVVYDDAAVVLIYNFLLFWLVLGSGLLLLTAYKLIGL